MYMCEHLCMNVSMFLYVSGCSWGALWGRLHTSIQAGVGLCERICEPVESCIQVFAYLSL